MIEKDNYKTSGSTLVEAAMIFPIIILVSVLAITTSLKIYSAIKENSIEHKEKITTQYELYEKGRILVSFHHNDFDIINGSVCSCLYCKS